MTIALTAFALALLFLGFPIFVVFLIVSAAIITFVLDLPLAVMAQSIHGSITNFILFAVPGYIMVGEVMGRGGMGRRLVHWAASVMGNIPGSVAFTTVATAEFFGTISGSSAATVAAIGKTLFPILREQGYDKEFSLGVITASGGIAIIIPPSISLILYGAVTDVSVGKLFIGGVLPGILIGLCLSGYIAYYVIKRSAVFRRGKWRWDGAEVMRTTKEAIWAIGMPILVLGGIYSGAFTPTEAAAVAAVYGAIVVVFIYKEMSLRELWGTAIETARLTTRIFIIIGAASFFSWAITAAGVPQSIALFLKELNLGAVGILAVINLFLLLVGMFMEPSSAMIVLAPLLMPIARSFGVDPLHFGLIMAVNLAIGMYTPPFGLNLFVALSIFPTNAAEVAKSIVPFFFANLVALALVTYVPFLSLWLPGFM